MKKILCLAGMLALVAAFGALSFGAGRTFTNNTGGPVTGIRITFSDMVWITSYDRALFPTQDPVGVASEITFSGGQLPSLGQFRIAWGEEYATVLLYNWISGSGSSSHVEYPTAFGIDYAHPEKYLPQGEQSKISNPAMLDSLPSTNTKSWAVSPASSRREKFSGITIPTRAVPATMSCRASTSE